MTQVKQYKPVDLRLLHHAPAEKTLAVLNKYRAHPDKRIRFFTFDCIANVALGSDNARASKEGVRQLLDSAEKDTSYSTRALENLIQFPHTAFLQQKSRQAIDRLLRAPTPYAEAVLVAGVSESPSAKPRLKNLARGPLNTNGSISRRRAPWVAHLALARMGDKKEIQFCIDTVENTQDPQTQLSLFEDLDYIRQPETMRTLISYLFSNRLVRGGSPDDSTASYAYFALSMLRRGIVGFPTNQDQGGDVLTQARAWSLMHRNNLPIKR